MSWNNDTKPSSSYSNDTKPSLGVSETWASILTTWAAETRTWAGMVSVGGWINDSK